MCIGNIVGRRVSQEQFAELSSRGEVRGRLDLRTLEVFVTEWAPYDRGPSDDATGEPRANPSESDRIGTKL